jgi:pilus assembly protein CpaF
VAWAFVHAIVMLQLGRAPASGMKIDYVELKGRIGKVAGRLFEGEEAVLHVIERIVAPLGLRVDEHHLGWMLDCRMAAGCRPTFLTPP